ncbi:FIP (Fungus-Induced Protein) Related [Caenorhabditis elegans]|uniref:FIP (Fungus-Induced Protein) Related n=1 Tax=Caenorhabditis elegans TaxID=6239 RepID=F5GU85_CAEEL|nr:FIP (Fungus-Induced Protein) Related [Caenorhabditis elegans]CCA65533.1 FIP (Fungus-Induced Protein) Related [Caenorhabditis elegans]|eukprot:NP_001255349.1 Uncharacterized protein CELE_C09G9.8 [Caenorhabditis elegans]
MNKIIVTFLFIIVIYFTCSEASLFGMKVKMGERVEMNF